MVKWRAIFLLFLAAATTVYGQEESDGLALLLNTQSLEAGEEHRPATMYIDVDGGSGAGAIDDFVDHEDGSGLGPDDEDGLSEESGSGVPWTDLEETFPGIVDTIVTAKPVEEAHNPPPFNPYTKPPKAKPPKPTKPPRPVKTYPPKPPKKAIVEETTKKPVNNHISKNPEPTRESSIKVVETPEPTDEVQIAAVEPRSGNNKLTALFSHPGVMAVVSLAIATSGHKLSPWYIAAVIGGAVVGLLCAILLIMFIVYRMKKKDEGSYSLEDHPAKKLNTNAYGKTSKEFYA
ncbi:PREDICTED: syndecan-like isoform X1 [Branchiostoma belcheri]|uniref:Syndecan n=1 Tax=Branchiostoma belcheri TaxID=7741 RepID=A0A6P4ZSM1_BRABE|nr:PREDICTED: syndecan-like isoform X1 [Branchiostoma belcheri]